MSREHLEDDQSRTDTGCDSHDTANNVLPVPNKHQSIPQPTHRSESFTRTNATSNTKNLQPPRVMGRRERSISPERKPSMKSSTSIPLKSAMRQPRASEKPVDDKLKHVYRSNSLPRDSKVEFTALSSSEVKLEPRKMVKTVRYDETVKSAEIAQDMPPSLSPAQAEEVLLPAKREAPIGGHDEKYSETIRPPAPAYHSIAPILRHASVVDASSKDLRDSIVNARKELLARKPENYGNQLRNNVIPTFENPHNNKSSFSPNGRQPRYSPPTNQLSYYRSQEAIKQAPPQPNPLPFSHYSTQNGAQLARQQSQPLSNRLNPSYSTSSLPRPQRSASTGQHNGLVTPRRGPLPSYDEIVQSKRPNKVIPQQPSNYTRMPPSYPVRNQTTSKPMTTDQQTRYRNSNSGPALQHRRSFHEVPPHDPLAVTDSSATVNNTGSCSSSNPDSGYSGNFYESTTNSRGSLAGYNSWYQQNIQTTALKMTAQQALADSRVYSVSPSSYRGAMNTPVINAPKRIVYANMTSDV